MKNITRIIGALCAFFIACKAEGQSIVQLNSSGGLTGNMCALAAYQIVGSDTAETSSTSTQIIATAHAMRVGDVIEFYAGTAANIGAWSTVKNVVDANTVNLEFALPTAPANGDSFRLKRPSQLDARASSGTGYKGLMVGIDADFTGSASGYTTNLLKLEDSASASGDAGVFALAVRNDGALTTLTNTNGDYSGIAVDSSGSVIVSGRDSSGATISGAPVRMGGTARTTEGGAVSDATAVNLSADPTGKLVSMPYAGAGNTWQACGTSTASTADVAIKAAVASNRIYVTSITCKNTSATVATTIDFKDATTVIAVGGISQMATTAPGSFTATFPVPLRGTVNTALNFAANVAVSSLTCCGAGYISVN